MNMVDPVEGQGGKEYGRNLISLIGGRITQ